jgi:hypothetical protein
MSNDNTFPFPRFEQRDQDELQRIGFEPVRGAPHALSVHGCIVTISTSGHVLGLEVTTPGGALSLDAPMAAATAVRRGDVRRLHGVEDGYSAITVVLPTDLLDRLETAHRYYLAANGFDPDGQPGTCAPPFCPDEAIAECIRSALEVDPHIVKAAQDGDWCNGACPVCGKSNGYLNIGRQHWFRCDEHKTRWCIGENLFSGWHDENEGIWLQNAARLEGYTVADGFAHPSVAPPQPVPAPTAPESIGF